MTACASDDSESHLETRACGCQRPAFAGTQEAGGARGLGVRRAGARSSVSGSRRSTKADDASRSSWPAAGGSARLDESVRHKPQSGACGVGHVGLECDSTWPTRSRPASRSTSASATVNVGGSASCTTAPMSQASLVAGDFVTTVASRPAVHSAPSCGKRHRRPVNIPVGARARHRRDDLNRAQVPCAGSCQHDGCDASRIRGHRDVG